MPLAPILLAVCWLGFALRVFRLDAQPFWFDERLTVDLVLWPPLYVLKTIDRPPLYYLLVHVWIGAAGATPLTIRLFSAWWGTLTLPAFYRLGRRLLGWQAGALALGLMALSPFYVYYAQEARTYALTLALVVVSSWVLLAWLDGGRRGWLALHATATLVCLYTHYVALLLPLAQAAFVLVRCRAKWHFTRRWLAAQAVVGLLFLPWPLYVWRKLPELIVPQAIIAPLPPVQQVARVLWTTLTEFSAGRTLAWPVSGGVALLFLFLVILGMLSPCLSARARCFLLLSLLVPLAALLLLPRTAIYFSPKYLIATAPAYTLLAAAGLQRLRREAPWLFVVCLLLALAVLLWGLGDWFSRVHFKIA